MANTKLTRTNGTSTNLKKWTWSAWIKRGIIGTQETFVVSRYDDGNYSRIRTDPDVLQFEDRFSSVTRTDIKSTEVLRDPNAWYHIVVRIDYTQSSAADRARMYVNGTEVTYSLTTRQSQDGNSYFNDSVPHALGHYNNNNYFHGCMSHVHFTDGYSYGPDTFGSTDSTTGEWKINTNPNVTYGNNGYFVLKDANGVTDQSGNSNNFTVGSGTLTQTEDNPSNNFARLNPLDNPYPGQIATFSNGLTTGAGTETGFLAGASTIGVSSGKYYAEFKITAGTSSYHVMGVVISPAGNMRTQAPHDNTNFYGVRGNGTKYQPGGTGTNSWTSTWTTNDIISLALDCDNNRLYIAKNGQYADGSGNYDEAFTGSPAYVTLASDKTYHFMGASITTGSGNSLTMQANFGNGFFGTTAISSEGTNASNLGKFEYDVPNGFTALCTKGLNE